MLILQNISYIHPGKDLLFENINLTVNPYDKIALIGNNGSGKSTLLKIISRELEPLDGHLQVGCEPYYVPQIFGQYNQLTVGEALRVEQKLSALREILDGNVTEENYVLLSEDWTIEERCYSALNDWQLAGVNLTQKMETLSGGQKTKVFLAGISVHQPKLILLDEPSNHLDNMGRELLYGFIQSTSVNLIVASHDRKLLSLLNTVCELNINGLNLYGGNYDFYREQRQIEREAFSRDLQNKEKALRKARDKERETKERQERLNARGKKKQEKAGVARIMMNTLRNRAEISTSKMKDVHAEKIGGISKELQVLRSALPGTDKMKFSFDNSSLHKSKILFKANDINYGYHRKLLWKENLTFEVISGERLALKGNNGSGKTTLIKIILGTLEPQAGTVDRACMKSVYIDQDYSLIDNQLKIYEQAQQFNSSALQEHEIKIRLNRFLFTTNDWDKYCSALSGGEKMRLMLCCLAISTQSPDMIVLDEPTNNLDLQNVDILVNAINDYEGTLIVVSHDDYFLRQINIKKVIQL